MKITEVTVGLTTSVNIAPYEYAKPELSMTAQLEDGDTVEEVIASLRAQVSAELTRVVNILRADHVR